MAHAGCQRFECADETLPSASSAPRHAQKIKKITRRNCASIRFTPIDLASRRRSHLASHPPSTRSSLPLAPCRFEIRTCRRSPLASPPHSSVHPHRHACPARDQLLRPPPGGRRRGRGWTRGGWPPANEDAHARCAARSSALLPAVVGLPAASDAFSATWVAGVPAKMRTRPSCLVVRVHQRSGVVEILKGVGILNFRTANSFSRFVRLI
ncbi:uncharacterized protein [Aegilops tauschii subsp. strangulata]|uniref:uncharacterized protein n=1 Tax=Aegilops tauschii subsp. strangulata TaxID=200361 RepID=UPI003CC88FE7